MTAVYLVEPGGEAVAAVPGIGGGIVGALYAFTHQGDIWGAAVFVWTYTMYPFLAFSQRLDHFSPNSALSIIELLIEGIGFVLALYTGFGGLIGGFIASMAIDIYAHWGTHS
jgi:hypothetical protein